MQDKATQLATKSAKTGLKIWKTKTKILRTNTTCNRQTGRCGQRRVKQNWESKSYKTCSKIFGSLEAYEKIKLIDFNSNVKTVKCMAVGLGEQQGRTSKDKGLCQKMLTNNVQNQMVRQGS